MTGPGRPVVAAGVAVVAAVALARAGVGVPVAAGAAATLTASLVAPRLRAVAGAVAVGALLGSGRVALAAPVRAPVPPPVAATASLAGTVRDLPLAHRGGSTVVVALDSGAVVALTVPSAPDALLPGDRVAVSPASALRSPSARPGPLSTAVLGARGVDLAAPGARLVRTAGGPWWMPSRVAASGRAAIVHTLGSTLPYPEAALAAAVAVGERPVLSAADDAALRRSGLVHLVATSGLKIAVVAGIAGRLLFAATVVPAGRRVGVALAVSAYAVLAGAGVAAVRSAATAVLGLAAAGVGRRLAPLPVLATLAALMALTTPAVVDDTGFRLTVLGTAGILLLAGPLAARLPGPRVVVEPFAVTVAAQLATLPVQVATFGLVSFVGPAANALVVPVVPPLILSVLAGTALAAVAAPVGQPLLLLAGLLARLVLTIAHLCDAVPGAAITVPAVPAAVTTATAVFAVCLVAAGRLALGRAHA